MSLLDRSKGKGRTKANYLGPEQFQILVSEVGMDDLVLLDVRSLDEFKHEHFQGAINIPIAEIGRRWKELDKDKRIAMYCRSGHRSTRAADVLCSEGFHHVFVLSGGLTAWNDYVKRMGKEPKPPEQIG